MSDALVLLRRQMKQLADHGWDEFKTKREVTDSHLRRMARVNLDPWLAAYAEGVQIQSPDLEYYLQQLNDILTLDQAKVDMTPLDQRSRAKDDVEDLRIYAASLWRKFNLGRRLDHPNAEGVNRYGFSAMRIFCEMPDEPGEERLGDVLDQVKRLVNRNAYFEERDDDDFTVDQIHPLSLRWWPLDPAKASIFIEEAIINYVDAVALQNQEGKWASLTEAGKVVYLGSPAPMDDKTMAESMGKKIHVVTRAAKDPITGRWKITEFLFEDGHVEDGEVLNEVECPFADGPYVVIPSGAELPLETTPHLRFRPRMQALYVDYVEKNFWSTMTAALGLKETKEVYLNLGTVDPRRQDVLGELFPEEGEGSQRRLVFNLARPGSGEITIAPARIEKMNPELSQGLVISLKNNDDAIARHAPNRFQTGNITPTEIAEGTGTAIINSMEASRLGPSNDLARIAHGISQVIERCLGAIRYWDEDSPSGTLKRYPALVTGEEPTGRLPDAGTRVWVDAEKASRPYQLQVIIQNQTQAEQQVSSLMILQNRAQGLIDDEQSISALGGKSMSQFFQDPGKQMQTLEKAKARKALEPYKLEAMTKILSVGAAALSGFNVPAIMGLTPPTPAATPAGPAPYELAPNRTPGGPPIETAAFKSPINPPAPPSPGSAGPQMTPAPVTSAAGVG